MKSEISTNNVQIGLYEIKYTSCTCTSQSISHYSPKSP